MSLSPTKDETTLALSCSTSNNSTFAVLQESNQKCELRDQYVSLLTEKPKILIFCFTRDQGTKPRVQRLLLN